LHKKNQTTILIIIILILIITTTNTTATNLTTNLYAYYPFEDTTETQITDIINGNNFTAPMGTPNTRETGKEQKSIYFDGTSGYSLNRSNADQWFNGNISENQNYTLSIWIKPTAAGGTIIGNYGYDTITCPDRTGFYIETTPITITRSCGIFNTATQTTSATTTINNWHHIVYRKAGSNHSFYTDGQLIWNVTGNNTITWTPGTGTPTGANLGIAHLYGERTISDGYTGYIDEMAYWTTALTDTQIITELYNNGDGLYYPFIPNTSATYLNLTFNNQQTYMIQDESGTRNETNTAKLWNMNNFATGYVTIYFNLQNTTWTQNYKFDNDGTQNQTANLYVIGQNTIETYYKTYDAVGNTRADATIRISQSNPDVDAGEYKLIGQTLTDGNGKAKFNIQPNLPTKIQVQKNGYENYTNFQAIMTTSNTEDTAIPIYMVTTETTMRNTLLNIPNEYTNNTAQIYGQIMTEIDSTIKYNTNYRELLGLTNYTATKTILMQSAIHLINLTGINDCPGTYCQIKIYERAGDGTETEYTQNMSNNTQTPETTNEIIPINTAGLDEKTIIRYGLIALIIIVIIMQMLLRTALENVGQHTFYIGTIFITFIAGEAIATIALLIIIGTYYTQPLIKKLTGTQT